MSSQKLPIIGEYFEREIPPSDNVSASDCPVGIFKQTDMLC